MIIYGSRDAQLQTKTLEDAYCTHCGQKGGVACTVFTRYAHVMWIPIFPIYKRLVCFCQNCGEEININDLPKEMQDEAKAFKKSQRAPFWQYIGLFIIAGIIASMVFSNKREERNVQKYLASPKVNDVYCIKYDEKEYSLMYVSKIDGDSVYFILNDYYMEEESNVQDLHQHRFYVDDELYGYSREELREYYDDKIILKIWRNLSFCNKQLKIENEETTRKIKETVEEEESDSDGDVDSSSIVISSEDNLVE